MSFELERDTEYKKFKEHMARYEAGERTINAEEEAYYEMMSEAGQAFLPVEFDTFLNYMARYEAGERKMSKEEENFAMYMQQFGPIKLSGFAGFLENMERYQTEKENAPRKK